ncbi:MAG TPA: carboxylesterase family protein [Bacteroidota bacterium]|nr:carboxylesterase family protein [Bacteroidota bacterium]
MKNISLFLFVCVFPALTFCQNNNPVLTIAGGKVIGVETPTKGVIAYKGIPFAAPPLGDLRWKEPQPVIPWDGIKVAGTFGAAAEQVTWDPESFYGKEWRASGSVPFSEDCLYLNIWTPAAGQVNKKLPVAMWIHGGGYREGFAFEPEMDGGEEWASRGVILVSVTYRLGVIGFFSHPLLSAESAHKVSGNYGLLDQAAALKWIHDNIEQFGGDPNNITIFGQSAGGGSVQSLCASPLSKNFISHAISMSAGGLGNFKLISKLDSALSVNKDFMDYFKKTSLKEMRALSFKELTQMAKDYADATKKRMFWGPVVDGYVLPGSFSDEATAGHIPDIPYMFGYTTNDLMDMTNAVKDFCALRAEKSKQPAYAYLFARQLPGDKSGAFHSSDLWYVFHSYAHSWRPFTAGDKALSNTIVEYYTNFAKYGNPNGASGNAWTPFSTAVHNFMVLDANENETMCKMTDTPIYKGNAFK